MGIAAFGALACGSKSDEDKARSAIEDAYSAFAAGDAEAFCEQLSSEYRADFEDYYGKCENDTIEGLLNDLDEDAIGQLESPDISELAVDGDSAEATVNDDDLEVVNEGDDWRLDDFDIPGGQ